MSDLQVWEQLLRIPELRVLGVEIKGDEVRVRAEVILEKGMCPGCRRVVTKSHQTLRRVIRHLPVFGRPCYIEFTEKQWDCESCGTFSPALDFVLDQYRRHSTAYGEYLFEQVKGSSIRVEAEKEGIAEKTLEEIYYAVARRKEREAKPQRT
jgi:transposase